MSENVQYPVSGYLIYVTDRHPKGNYTGLVVIYALGNLQFAEDVVRDLADNGAPPEAVLFVFGVPTPYPGIYSYTKAWINTPSHPFPCFDITASQAKDELIPFFYSEPGGYVYVTFTGDDPNPWDQPYREWLPGLSFVILVMSCFTCTMAVYKLTLFFCRDGVRFAMAPFVLVMNLIAQAIRIAWVSVDPLGTYNIYPYWWVQVGLTIPFPFVIASALVIVLYWHEMMAKSGHKMNPFLDKMLKPFLGCALFLFVFELATSAARGAGAVVGPLVIADGVVFAIVILALLIFLVITKIRLSRTLRALNKRLNRKENRLRVTSRIILAIAITLTIYMVSLFMVSTSLLFWEPVGFYVLMWILLMSQNVLCLLQVLLIRPPQRTWKWIFCGLFIKDPALLLPSRDDTEAGAASSYSMHSMRTTSRATIEYSVPK